MAKPKSLTPSVEELEKAFDNDLDLVLFFLSWIKNERNASKAYLELNPNVDPHSARVLGSRKLAKINIPAIMEIYGVGFEDYFSQLKQGHEAMKWNDFTGEREADHKTRGDYSKRIGKLLGVEKEGNVNIQVNNFIPILGNTNLHVSENHSNQ